MESLLKFPQLTQNLSGTGNGFMETSSIGTQQVAVDVDTSELRTLKRQIGTNGNIARIAVRGWMLMTRLIDADALIRSTIYNPRHVPYIAKSDVEAAPTVDAVPIKHGKWLDGHCSICGCDVPAYVIDWKWQKDMNARFCPMCGARMVEE